MAIVIEMIINVKIITHKIMNLKDVLIQADRIVDKITDRIEEALLAAETTTIIGKSRILEDLNIEEFIIKEEIGTILI